MTRYISDSHTYGESYLHLQFTPKKRRKAFQDTKVLQETRNQFTKKSRELGITLIVAEFGPDHCHLFLQNWKNYSIPQLAQFLKGSSSHALRAQFHNLRLAVDSKSFWTDGYFYETVGSVTAQAREFYIRRCQGKHWKNIEYPEWSKEQTQLTKFIREPSAL